MLACRADPPPPAAPILNHPVEGETVRFIAMGDWGKGNDTQREVAAGVAAVCERQGCNFVLSLGDNLYPKGAESPEDPQFQEKFERPYAALQQPFYLVPGNHDYGEFSLSPDKLVNEIAYTDRSRKWRMPAPFYSLQSGPVSFFALDTQAVLGGRGGPQAAWLARAISTAPGPWRIAFGHHPYISNGKHGNAGRYEGLPLIPIASGGAVKEFIEGSLCGQVDLYLCGHDHNRQWLAPTCGTEFVVSGAGASVVPLEGRGTPTLFEEDTRPGFLWVEVMPDQLTGVFYDSQGQESWRRQLKRPKGGS